MSSCARKIGVIHKRILDPERRTTGIFIHQLAESVGVGDGDSPEAGAKNVEIVAGPSHKLIGVRASIADIATGAAIEDVVTPLPFRTSLPDFVGCQKGRAAKLFDIMMLSN